MIWDIFCKVIDNFGDIGVALRLAKHLASRGQRVRLYVDDIHQWSWLGLEHHGLECLTWQDARAVGDVVIEAFGCTLPDRFLQPMAVKRPSPLWINIEYLTAEKQAENNHGLLSPVAFGPAKGLAKWFFYPGFTPKTGGLLREPDLLAKQTELDKVTWLKQQGIPWQDELLVSLFCYPSLRLIESLSTLAQEQAILFLVACHHHNDSVVTLLKHHKIPFLKYHYLPLLTQEDFDCLLWICDINVVRGEDSFIRGLWANRPLIWHIYPQDDDAHRNKLLAFLEMMKVDPVTYHWHLWWNHFSSSPPTGLPSTITVKQLLSQDDLVTQLIRFVHEKRIQCNW
jgi:uncharacterized repeat protein (TIGR03837 family)